FCVALDAALPRGAPAALRAAAGRGRSPDPAARFPAMRPLLARLRHDPARTRRRVLLAGALAGLAGLAARRDRLVSVARAVCKAPAQASEACLARHREGLAALVKVLAAADGAVVD